MHFERTILFTIDRTDFSVSQKLNMSQTSTPNVGFAMSALFRKKHCSLAGDSPLALLPLISSAITCLAI